MTVDVQGFRKSVQKDRRVESGATLTVDVSLEVKIAEEVTVTAMKREETLLDTPVSIAAPTEEVMRERGVESLEDAFQQPITQDFQGYVTGTYTSARGSRRSATRISAP